MRPHPLPFFVHLSFSDKEFLDWARPPPPSPFMKKNWSKLVKNWCKKRSKFWVFFAPPLFWRKVKKQFFMPPLIPFILLVPLSPLTMSTVLTVSIVSTVSASYSAVLPPSLVIFCVCNNVLHMHLLLWPSHLTLQALIVIIYWFTGSFSRPKLQFQNKDKLA